MSTLTKENFDRIWLEPREGADPYIGRQWCQDNQWGEGGIEYVRADLAPAPQEQLMGLSELMKDGFLTCVAEPGRPFVKVNFPTLKQAQALHEALAKATTEGQPDGR